MLWKPAEVLPKDKRRAITLFLALLLGILAYSGYLIYEAVEERKNPSTSFRLLDQVYQFPDMYVCLYDFYGCDDANLEEECVFTATDTEGGRRTGAVFNPGEENEQNISASGLETDTKGWCVSFRASEVEITERHRLDYILLDMYWYPGGGADASTTCIPEQGEWESHSESVYIFLRHPDTDALSAGIQVPYSCMTRESSSHAFAILEVGLTREYKITEDDTAAYTALTTSSAIHKDEMTENVVNPYAWLSMRISQSPNSLREIEEIDPLEVAEMFGNVGGFWDLLLILWPIFFVAVSRQEPHLKIRNFKKSVVRGSEHAIGSIGISLPRPLKRIQRGCLNFSPVEGERVPAWDRERGAPVRQHFPAKRFSHGSVTRTALSGSPPTGAAAAANIAPPLASSSTRSRRFHAPASGINPNPHVVRVNSSLYRFRSTPFQANPSRGSQDNDNSSCSNMNAELPTRSRVTPSSMTELFAVRTGDAGCVGGDGGERGGGRGDVRQTNSDDVSSPSLVRDGFDRVSEAAPLAPPMGSTVGGGGDMGRSGGCGGGSSGENNSRNDSSDIGSRNSSGPAVSGTFVV